MNKIRNLLRFWSDFRWYLNKGYPLRSAWFMARNTL